MIDGDDTANSWFTVFAESTNRSTLQLEHKLFGITVIFNLTSRLFYSANLCNNPMISSCPSNGTPVPSSVLSAGDDASEEKMILSSKEH